jgi:mono/diheme cytochrome c family protein
MPGNYSCVLPALVIALLVSGCDQPDAAGTQQTSTAEAIDPKIPSRNQDFKQILRGGRIYQQNCAACHGKLAQGAPDWRQRDANGKFPPPPLNGTGHTWHHPTEVLVDIIRNGTGKLGGNMPAWRDKLSDQDIEDVLAWIKAQWPDETYATWYQINQRNRQ